MPRSETCRDARRGLAYYTSRRNEWRSKMGAAGRPSTSAENTSRCPQIRRAASWMRAKAHEWRLRYERWAHEYAWWIWLPGKFARVGHCETGSTPGGTAAGNWRWDSGRYVSAFGIYRPAYEAFHRWTGRNTPREQYEVAAAIQARFGWSAWGCGGA